MIRYCTAAILILLTGGTFAWAQTYSKDIIAKPAAELVEILQHPNAPMFDKSKACQRLAVIGTKESVPALAALLADEKLNHYARFALECIPDHSVDAALRDAATKLQGRPLVGVIDSIGQRKDAQAIGLLNGLLENSDASVASAAAAALGQIGTSDAAEILQVALGKHSPIIHEIAAGCLVCADRLAASGKKTEAVALLNAVAKTTLPKHLQASAVGGQLQIQQGQAKDLLLVQLRNPDKVFFDVGLAFARQIPGADITASLTEELPKLPPERQALLLCALAGRKDPTPMPIILDYIKSESPLVRQAAIQVLVKHDDASVASILLDAILGDVDVAQTAKEKLKNLPGQQVDAKIIARVAGADAKAKIVLLEILAARRIAAALPAIREAIGDGNESVRLSALAALGQLAELADIDVLLDKALADGALAETVAAQTALRTAVLRISDRDACAARLAAKLDGASIDHQVYLLGLLGKLSGSQALEAVAVGAKSADPTVKNAATKVLGEWNDAEAASLLLDIAKNDADRNHQTRALRGYIRIARQFQISDETRLAMFHTAMATAIRPEEKRLALDILSRIPSGETIQLAASCLGDPSLKDQAGSVAVKIAAKIAGSDLAAVAEAMQAVVEAGASGKTEDDARRLLEQSKLMLTSRAAADAEKSFAPLFDGKTFHGWEGNLEVFRIEDGAIVGGSVQKPLEHNYFLCTEKTYGDFELQFQCKLIGDATNGGVQIRSRRIPDNHAVSGYQADMADGYWGCLYDESRRNKILAGPTKEEQTKIVREGDWNDYIIRCEGRRIQLWVNGRQTVDYAEPDADIPRSGVIGLQVHAGKPSEVWYKDIRIKNLSGNPSK